MIYPRAKLNLIDHPLDVKLPYNDYEVICMGETIGIIRQYSGGTLDERWILTEPFIWVAGIHYLGKKGAKQACERLVKEVYENYDEYDETLNFRRDKY